MQVVIVSPALSDANNGNWQTARRWRRALASLARVRVTRHWPDEEADRDDAMIALHARRSADAIAAWHGRHGSRGLAVVLTGTDLHRDIGNDARALESLGAAQILVVLHERGIAALPSQFRDRARVLLQSATPRRTLVKGSRQLRLVMVGHLRAEKTPTTLFAAARLLADRPDIRISHIGGALDAGLGAQAEATMAQCPNYRWLGNQPHGQVRRTIQRAHAVVHTSRMEGGANVVIEAIASGTPVIASRVEGNVGILGEDYGGYFPWDDAEALAARVRELRRSQDSADGLLARLRAQVEARAPLFAPAAEAAAIRRLADDLASGYLAAR